MSTVLKRRFDDLLNWPRIKAQADIVHVHYATNGYYGWSSKPFVLHVHGSDIRLDWHKPGLREVITRSLKRADVVLYSTTDLYDHIKMVRPDAIWSPNPLPHEFLELHQATEPNANVFFSSRWDESKGLDVLIPLAHILVSRGIRVTGLDWGTHKHLARAAGVELYPLMSRSEFARVLASAGVVVGQLKFPVLSMTDYQTLALNRPLICAASIENPPASTVTTGNEVGLARDPNLIADETMRLLAEENPRTTRQWVLERHHPQICVKYLEDIYTSIL
ncbi:hypothetical protein HMPREF2891_03840 [Actinomyces sp. HMSC065F11]|nr:hypothetical protein HMPREF2891_03840 [Actinomyces sp. HMSC065F11]